MKTNVDLRHIYPVISGTLTGGDGTAYSLDGHSVPAGSLSFKSGTSPSGTFAVGGAVIGSVSFALLDAGRFSSVVWKNARVAFTLTCDQTAVDMGSFYIVSHSESGGVISVTGMDALKILDGYEMHELNITYPTTAGALAAAIASAHGLTVSGLRNPSLSIADPGNDRMTQRACLSHLAQVSGQFVKVTGSTISFGWYDLSSPYDDGGTFGHDWGTDDVTITGVRVTDKDGSTNHDRGTDGYRIEISNNPFITADNASSVADTIWAAVGGISFRAGSAEILASPAIEAGDCVVVRTPDETGVKLIVTNLTYTPDVSMSITSDADAQEGDLQLNKSPYVRPAEAKQQADSAIADQLADPDSDLSKAIAGGGGGGTGDGTAIIIADQDLQLPSASLGFAAYRYGAVYVPSSITIDGTTYTVITRNDLPTYITGISVLEEKVVIPSYSDDASFFPIPLSCRVGSHASCGVTLRGTWATESKIKLDLAENQNFQHNPWIARLDGASTLSEDTIKVCFNPGIVKTWIGQREWVPYTNLEKVDDESDPDYGKWRFTTLW